MADDLSTPLGNRPRGALKPKTPRRIDLLRPLAIVVVVAVGAAALWIGLVYHPLGGEPVATAAIERDLPPPPPPAHQAAPAGTALAAAVAAAAQKNGGSGPLIIKVPRPGGDAAAVALPQAPAEALMENSKYGLLPRIADDGRRPSDIYARGVPAAAAGKPQVAILVGGLGVGAAATAVAIDQLPPEISLGFPPYSHELGHWLDEARQHGHEIIVQVPMEPFDFPSNDPGPQTLLSSLPTSANLERLRWTLGRAAGYVGLSNYMGAKFTASAEAMRPVLTEAARRGLLFIDDGASPESLTTRLATEAGATATQADLAIDAVPTADAIDAALAALVARARRDGHALGVARPLPVTLARLSEWASTLSAHGIALVPVSAIARRAPSRS